MTAKAASAFTVAVSGTRTTVYSYGPEVAHPILAIHGFRGTHYGLEPLAYSLADAGYRVLVPDLPGAGASTPMSITHDAAGYGLWLRELTRQFTKPMTLLGHSFGSVIVGSAIAQGATHAGTVLINPILTSPLAGPRVFATAATRAYYALARLLPEPMGRRLLSSRTIASIGGTLMTSVKDRSLRRWIRQEHRRQAGAFASRDVVLESFAASTLSTVTDFAPTFTRPTLVLGAQRDPLTPVSAYTAELRGIANGVFHIFPESGHLLPYESADMAARLIAQWEREEPVLMDATASVPPFNENPPD